MTWQQRGACRGEDPELWFPISDKKADQVDEARAVCRGCPVRDECLDYALTHAEGEGVWGGTTPSERRRLRAGAIA